ncbi:MAG: hypothetical protein ACREF7_02685, partial [Candidatus Saccharimonadales bacterium]
MNHWEIQLMNIEKGTVVTLSVNSRASNTYLVDKDEGETLMLTHPLASGTFIRVNKADVNLVSASVKDSSERCLDFANSNRKLLDHNTCCDLDALGMYFFVNRGFTPRQKQVLAAICGIIATMKFNNDLKSAMELVSHNVSVLDEFNAMWYNNFKGLFQGKQSIT